MKSTPELEAEMLRLHYAEHWPVGTIATHLGIATRLAESVAEIELARGNRVTITATHPAIVGHCANSPNWHYLGLKKTGSTRQRSGPTSITPSSMSILTSSSM